MGPDRFLFCSAFAALLCAYAGNASIHPHSHQLAARQLLGSSFGTPANATFDYVIVGGGVGGLTMASRLSEAGSKSVAVIEAGSFYEIDNGNLSQIPADDTRWTGKDPQDVNPLIDWGFVTVPQAGCLNASIHYARGKTLGGCSARNYMAYQRGSIGSYQEWADDVDDQSYAFEQWLPFFEKSLNYTPPDMSKRAQNATPDVDLDTLGIGDGPLSATFSNYANAMSSYVQKGLAEIGIPSIQGFTSGYLNGSSYVVENINATTQERESSETAFLRPALGRPNLIVYQQTMGMQILFDSNKKAVGVKANQGDDTFTLSANQEVIVSAGAFQSPQLLMVSGVGPKEVLDQHNIPVIADRPGVGQNMWDHVLMGPSYRVNVITASSLANPSFAANASEEFDAHQAGILTNSGGDFLAWEKIPSTLRTSFPNDTLAALATFPADWPELEYISMSGELGYQQNYLRDAPTDGYNYATVSAAVVAPSSRGTISLNSSSMVEAPLIDPQWLTHPADQALAVAGYKRVRQMFASDAVKPVLIGGEYFPGGNTTDAEVLDIVRQSVSTVYHAACTCKMGKTSDPMAVVDSQARVIGVSGLRVVDASAFALLPPGHPISTIYALAEKIAANMTGASTTQPSSSSY